ncbi:hypothetical protein PIB30_034112 [Stylosanthes scabra]|uniref:Uncharacterized protein n=1 Tax=Stylosanthes scabra TaxID=79078 RepID=A0ABU6SDG1_9FABA|nr:hypothetical protein [Stylosanthes scabra]
MGSPTLKSDETFPAADVAAELNPGNNTHVHVDPISSEVAAAKEIKETEEMKKERQKKEALQKLKSGIIITAVVVAVAGEIQQPNHSRKNMDTSNPAVFVNAELLQFYVGRRVRAVIQILQSEGGVVIGKSTDERQLVVKGPPPPVPLTNFVEVIGIVDNDRSIRAEIWTNFGNAIDMFSYNKLCQLANGEFKHLFV